MPKKGSRLALDTPKALKVKGLKVKQILRKKGKRVGKNLKGRYR